MVSTYIFFRAYKLNKQEDINLLYTKWADTYDDELNAMNYQSPKRCVSALAQVGLFEAPVFDFDYGTGLSGQALLSVGFKKIFEVDISRSMINGAKRRRSINNFTIRTSNLISLMGKHLLLFAQWALLAVEPVLINSLKKFGNVSNCMCFSVFRSTIID